VNTDPRHQCHRKVQHKTRKLALAAMYATIRRHNDLTLNVYKCPHCRLFHVGHAPSYLQAGLIAKRTNK
jgi:hypothetical protein